MHCLRSRIHLFGVVDDTSILWFLRGCKFNIEATYSRIESFYSFRCKLVEWYTERDPLKPELADIIKLG